QRDAMIGHPAANAHADRGDLLLSVFPVRYPDADAALAPFAVHAEMDKRADQPFFEIAHETAHAGFALAQIEHHVGHALSRSVIGELAAPSRLKNGKPRIKEV